MSILVVTLDSDPDEQEDVPDLLKQCTNQPIPMNEINNVLNRSETDENKPQMYVLHSADDQF